MRLSEELKNSFTYADTPKELAAYVTFCPERDNQIRQQWPVKVVPNRLGGTVFASSPQLASPPKDPAGAPAGTIPGYTEPPPMVLSAGTGRIWVE